MIVISTHNNCETLVRLINSILHFSSEHHNILIIETSNNVDSKETAQLYNCDWEQVLDTYDSGAYNYAMKNYISDDYFMFQDSIEIRVFNWEILFKKYIIDESVFVGIWQFPILFDSEDGDTIFAKDLYEKCLNKPLLNFPPRQGTIGPNFYITRKTAEKLMIAGCDKFIPLIKQEARAMERIWCHLAHDVEVIPNFAVNYTCGEIVKHYLHRQ